MGEIIIQGIPSQIANGMDVYDADGKKIGTVQQYDLSNGWFETEKGGLFPKDRFIPFSAIDRIGPSGIYLSVSKDYVKEMYDRPPMVDVDVVAGPAGVAAVGTVASGYDSSRVVVDDTTISTAISRLGNGLKVYDFNGEKIGRVYQYDPGSGWFVVEKGVFSSKDLYVPVTAVEYLDGDGVHLRVTKEVLTHAFVVPPANVTFVSAGESLASQVGKGLAVYDSDGDRIGTVQQYDLIRGWFQTEKGGLFPKDRYIPFSAIAYIDGSGAHLAVSRDYVKEMYDQPPMVDVDVVAGPAGVAAVGSVASGYDASRVVVDSTTISQAVERMKQGPKVYDSNGEHIGRVNRYDPSTGWMVVEKGKLFPKDLFIPVTAVEYLDGDGVHLRVTKEVLTAAFVLPPANVTFVAITE